MLDRRAFLKLLGAAGVVLALPVELLRLPKATAILPAFGGATRAGNLLVAFVASDDQRQMVAPPNPGWSRLATAVEDDVRAEVWYKANCRAGEPAPDFPGKFNGMLAEFTQPAKGAITLEQTTSF